MRSNSAGWIALIGPIAIVAAAMLLLAV